MRAAVSLCSILALLISPALAGPAPELQGKKASPADTGKHPYVLSLASGAVFRKGSGGYECPALDYKLVGSNGPKSIEVVVKTSAFVLRTSRIVPLPADSGTLKPVQWSGSVGDSIEGAFMISGAKVPTEFEVAFFDPHGLMKKTKENFPESARLSPWLKVPRK
jgi:hypothetical protein